MIAACLMPIQMQEACIDNELINHIAMKRLIDNYSKKGTLKTFLRERKIYTRDIVSLTQLPSSPSVFSIDKDTRSTGYPLYRYREFTSTPTSPIIDTPTITSYENVFSFTKYATGADLGSTLEIVFSTSIYNDGNRKDTSRICVLLPRREKRDSLDYLILTIIGSMFPVDKDSIRTTISKMKYAINRWNLLIPQQVPLTWNDVSMDTFRDSVIVEVQEGDPIFYVLSPSGTFMVDTNKSVIPIDMTISTSTSILIGRYNKSFYPYDILVDNDADVHGYSYDERLDMLSKYKLPQPLFLSRPSTPDKFFSFIIGKKELLIYSPTKRMSWTSSIKERLYIGEGGIPMGIEKELVPVDVKVSNPIDYIGKIVNVENHNITSIDRYASSPMKKSRIENLEILSLDPISLDSLSGSNCDLYDKYVSRMMSLLYSFYNSRSVKSVFDISDGLDHTYWKTPGMTTYTISTSRDRSMFQRMSGGIIDENIVVSPDWEVDFVSDSDLGEIDVGATNIYKPKIDNIDTYINLSTSYLSFLTNESTHRKIKEVIDTKEWEIETEYRLNKEELLPLDEKCIDDLTIYIWRKKEFSAEIIRLIYTPIVLNSTSTIETPYGTLVRTGTLGATTSGKDDSFIHALLTSYSSDYRKLDRVARTLYVIKNRNSISIRVPIYIIPKDSWTMYNIGRKDTLVYDYNTQRPPGVVLFINKNHWEPLSRKNIDGSLNYIW